MTSTRAPAARPASRTPRQPASPGGRVRRWRGSPPLTLLAVAMGVMMVGLDGTIVAVANPAIQSHLHASLAGIQWISNAYLLALAVSLIPAGKAGDRFGHKKVALAGALSALIFGLIKGPDYGWGSARTLGFLGAAALLGLLFILRESRARQPLLPLKLFRSASVSAGVVLVILLMFALFGAMFFMTFFLENVHGLSPIAAGVHLLPMTAMLIVGSPLAGALISKLGPRLPLVAG